MERLMWTGAARQLPGQQSEPVRHAFYLDRYNLMLMVILVALTIGMPGEMDSTLIPARARVVPRLAVLALALFATVALVGTRDALRFNRTIGDVWRSLVHAGVPASDIDAGYAWNGWMLYAHPGNLAPGLSPLRDVPWITSDRRIEYVIAKAQRGIPRRPRALVAELPMAQPDRLLVLKQVRLESPHLPDRPSRSRLRLAVRPVSRRPKRGQRPAIRLVWSPQSLRDAEAIRAYIAEDLPVTLTSPPHLRSGRCGGTAPSKRPRSDRRTLPSGLPYYLCRSSAISRTLVSHRTGKHLWQR